MEATPIHWQDPDSRPDECAVVAVDHDTGDLILNGHLASEGDVAALRAHTAIADHEATIRIPARMRSLLEKALHAGPSA